MPGLCISGIQSAASVFVSCLGAFRGSKEDTSIDTACQRIADPSGSSVTHHCSLSALYGIKVHGHTRVHVVPGSDHREVFPVLYIYTKEEEGESCPWTAMPVFASDRRYSFSIL